MTNQNIALRKIASECLLCNNAKCDKACPHNFKPSNFLRSIAFDNEDGATKHINKEICGNCSGFCENACIHYHEKVHIQEAIKVEPEMLNVLH